MGATLACKPVKKGQVAVCVSKDKNDPRRILGGNHQYHATWNDEDAPQPMTEAPHPVTARPSRAMEG